jgi:hypothetical protein
MNHTHAQLMDAAALRSVAERMQLRGEGAAATLALQLAKWTEMCVEIPVDFVHEVIADTVERPNYDELDPGIREVVRFLNDRGFHTTDSGDGRSKPQEWFDAGDAIPYPHVVVASSPMGLAHEALSVARVLGPQWSVEGTFVAATGSAYLFVSQPPQVEI